MGKACNYQHQRAGNGGLFVVRTDTARCYRKYIWLSTHLQHKGLDIDTAQEKKFANLVNRNSIGDNPWVGGFFYKSTDGVKEVSTQDLHFADEMHLDLNPTNYYSIVKGIIPYAETSYPGTKIGKLNTEENWPRWALGHRLKKQEILIKAFQGLKILQDWSPSELIKYRKIGKALSRNIEQVTSVSVLALTKLPYSLYPIKLPTETLATLQK